MILFQPACLKCIVLLLLLVWPQIRKKNVLKDFVAIAGPLGVTHFMIFSKTPSSLNMVSSDDIKQFLYWRTLQFRHLKSVTPSIHQHFSCAFRDLLDFPKVPCFISECSRYEIKHEHNRYIGSDDDSSIFHS